MSRWLIFDQWDTRRDLLATSEKCLACYSDKSNGMSISPFLLKVNNTKEPSNLQAVNQPRIKPKRNSQIEMCLDGTTHNLNFLLPVLTVSYKPLLIGFLLHAFNRILTEFKLIFLRIIKSCKLKNNSFFYLFSLILHNSRIWGSSKSQKIIAPPCMCVNAWTQIHTVLPMCMCVCSVCGCVL